MFREYGEEFRSRLPMAQIHSWKILYDGWVNDIMVRAREHGDALKHRRLASSILNAMHESREAFSTGILWQKELVKKENYEAQLRKSVSIPRIAIVRELWVCSKKASQITNASDQ